MSDTLDLQAERAKYSLPALGIDVEEFYRQMTSMEVSIDLTINPDIMYVNRKMVEVREASLSAQRLYLRIQKATGSSQSWLLNLETSFDILSSSKMENDAEVRAGQSIDDRKAIVNNKLVDYKRAIKEAKNNVSLLKSLNKALDLCIKNIDRSDADVKQQARLMESQMRNLKTRDVSEAMRDSNLKRTETDMAELDKLYEGALVDSTSVSSVGSLDSADPEVIVGGEEQEVAIADTQPQVAAEPDPAEMADCDAAEVEPLVVDMDDEVTLAPGLTGAADVVSSSLPPVVADEEFVAPRTADELESTPSDLLDMLDSIPSVTKKELGSTSPVSMDTGDVDDCFGLNLDDMLADEPEQSVVAVVSAEDDMDPFAGAVASSVATEQKPPKLLASLSESAVGKTAATKAPPAEKKAAKAATPKQETKPAIKPAQDTQEMSLDDLINDLGI